MNQLCAHHQIIIEKFGRAAAVGANTTDIGSQMNDHVNRLCGGIMGKQAIDCRNVAEIIVGATRHNNLRHSPLFEFSDNDPPQEPRAARNDDTFVMPKGRRV